VQQVGFLNRKISIGELLVLFAFGLMVGFVFWPNLLRSKKAANEASAVNTLRELGQAEITYAATYPSLGFAASIDELGGLAEPCVPSPQKGCLLGEVAKPPYLNAGYTFAADGLGSTPRIRFFSTAVPFDPGSTGQLSFCGSNYWAIHYRSDGQRPADPESCESIAVHRDSFGHGPPN
jgi:type IV pilus assembly protein PilA